MSNRDWRESAYLRKENWPEAIPWTYPKREYGPYPWGHIDHDPEGLDEYQWNHPDAASVGGGYMGDVCPWCGVPIAQDESAISRAGADGELHQVSPDENPRPAYHPECYHERKATIHGLKNKSLTEFQE